MKNLAAILGLLTITCTSFAATRNADRVSLFMVSDIVTYCPSEFAQAMKGKTILSLTSDYSKDQSGKWSTTSILSTGYTGSPMNPGDVVKTVVTLVDVPKDVQPADGYFSDKFCSIKEVK